MNYKDKFLSSDVFQWESIAKISKAEEERQKQAKNVYVFVRKVKSEKGLVGVSWWKDRRRGVPTCSSSPRDTRGIRCRNICWGTA